MGYETLIIQDDIRFVSKELKEAFKKDEELKELPSPINGNSFVEFENEELYVSIEDYSGKFSYDVNKWIPRLAKYIKGTIDFSGEEALDFWCVSFDGKGGYKVFKGEISYEEEIELWGDDYDKD